MKRFYYLFIFISLFSFKESYSKVISSNKILETQLNDYFEEELITKEGIEAYLIKNNYFKSKVLELKVNHIVLNPIQSFFIIKGNKFLNDYEIQKITNIDETQLGINLHQTFINSIKKSYREKGFQKVHITQDLKRKKFKEWVYIKINEGLRSRIAKIHVTGSLSRPSIFYSDFIINHSSTLMKEGYFNRKDLEKGYQNLTTYLKSKGYLTNKVYSDRVIHKEHLVYITVNLEEGPITLIREIKLKGNHSIPDSQILSQIKSKTQSPLQQNVLEEDLERIKHIYNEKGYLKMKFDILKNTITYDKGYRHAFIKLNINEGEKSLISKIIIKGNQSTERSLIEKSLKFKLNEILTLKKINQSIAVLNSFGIFKNVNIQHDNQKNTTVTVIVKEGKSRYIRGGLGLTTQRRLTTRAYVEYTHKNFFRYGRTFLGKMDGQTNLISPNPILEYKISGNYQETFLIEQQIKGNVVVSRSRNIFSYSSRDINTVEKDQINFSIDKIFNPYLKLNFTAWNLETRKESCVTTCPENLQKIGSTNLNITYDRRNNAFNPKKGFLMSLTGEYASPEIGSSADIQFWKFYFQNQFYISFPENYVLAMALRGGFISSSHSIPVGRAFLLGGQSSIRGYDGYVEGERIPDSTRVPIQTANERLRLLTGNKLEKVKKSHFGLFKIELRFPVFKNFTSLIFYDIGAVNLKTSSQDFLQYGHSAGLGFRYETFLIPIGLDIGYKLNQKFGSSYKFHLSIGLF